MKKLIQHIYKQAHQLGACDKFSGNETLEQLVQLMFTPQGIEFCLANNFPDLATFRRFKRYHPERLGVYIDCGQITLQEPQAAFLIGNTTATVKCQQTARKRLYLMHGAHANVNASGFTVVRVEKDPSSQVTVQAKDNAKILM